MPTRVVLDESPSAIEGDGSHNIHLKNHGSFRSSLMRSVVEPNREPAIYTSATDIRASPRLAGYLYILIGSIVMVASVSQLYKDDDVQKAFFDNYKFQKKEQFVLIGGARVFIWKFIGAFVVACVGISSSLLIVLVHFDTFLFPRFWVKVFRDGSLWERNLLILNMIFWSAGLHMCTSSFSIGATQANVYFTAWIAFIASALTLDIWRVSANLSNLSGFVSRQQKTTLYNWCYAFFFCSVSAASVTDMYINREYFVFYDVDGNPITVLNSDWNRILAVTWAAVVASALVIVAKVKWSNWHKVCSYLEGLLIAAFIGVSAWACTTFTGVQGAIRGPSNAYFGLWGTFFSSLTVFGTWLRETGGAQKLRHLSQSTGSSIARGLGRGPTQ